jgi:hypothetical protein
VLQEFIEHHLQCKVHIVFTCLYRKTDSRHSDALRSLDGYSNVQRLGIFTRKEWRMLRDRNILILSPEAFHITILWDCYWRRELTNSGHSSSEYSECLSNWNGMLSVQYS